MVSAHTHEFGFAAAHDAPIPYLVRVRDYYEALGYGAPYEWAHYSEVPFQPLRKRLSKSCIAIVTTAAPYQPGKGDQGPGARYNGAAKFYTVYSGDATTNPDVRISHVAIDRKHTTAEDPGTFFPLVELRKSAGSARVGSIAPHFYGAPTNRSQRVTLEVDCPEILARCSADGVDAAILVPNCPICHQSLSLVARLLEQSGITTVVMGCAKDIVEYVGVPRFLFSDFPLGNAAGRPGDLASQTLTLELALKLIETAPAPRTTVQSPLRWTSSPDWKLDYCNIERLSQKEIRQRRSEFDRGKSQAKRVRSEAGLSGFNSDDEFA